MHDFRYIFEYIIVIVIFSFVSRPGRLLFSLVVKGNNNNKKKRKTRRGNTREDPRPDKPKARPDRQNRTSRDKTRQNKKETLPKLTFGGSDASLGPPKVFFLGLHYCFVHHCCSSILGLHYCQNPGGSQLGPSRTKAFILMQGLSRWAQVRLQSFHAFEIHSKCYPKSLWGTQVRSKQRCLKIPFQNSPLGVPSWSQVFQGLQLIQNSVFSVVMENSIHRKGYRKTYMTHETKYLNLFTSSVT